MKFPWYVELLMMIIIASLYFWIRYTKGTRIYYQDNRYITLRELMLPSLFCWAYMLGLTALGYSPLWHIILILGGLSLLLLIVYWSKGERFSYRKYFHLFASISYLILVASIIVLEFLRFF